MQESTEALCVVLVKNTAKRSRFGSEDSSRKKLQKETSASLASETDSKDPIARLWEYQAKWEEYENAALKALAASTHGVVVAATTAAAPGPTDRPFRGVHEFNEEDAIAHKREEEEEDEGDLTEEQILEDFKNELDTQEEHLATDVFLNELNMHFQTLNFAKQGDIAAKKLKIIVSKMLTILSAKLDGRFCVVSADSLPISK